MLAEQGTPVPPEATLAPLAFTASPEAVAQMADQVDTIDGHPLLWAGLRFIDGLCIAGVYICLESWLNERAEPQVTINQAEGQPKITVEQAGKFGEALLKGTPHRNKIALTVLSDKVKELI